MKYLKVKRSGETSFGVGYAVWMRVLLVAWGFWASNHFLQGANVADHVPRSGHRKDRILIVPKVGSPVSGMEGLHSKWHARGRKFFGGQREIQVVELPSGGDVAEFVARYVASGWVEAAEPDYWVTPLVVSNDPQFLNGAQWHLSNEGQLGGALGADIHASRAWSTRTDASNVVVALVDTGVLITHEDIAPNLWTNPREIAGNGLDDDGNGIVDDVHGINAFANNGDLTDATGHGTMVAGFMGAAGNNGLGIAGVAWNVKVMPCRYVDNTGAGSISDVIQCLDYARAQGAQVINASFASTNYSAALHTALVNCRTAGIVVVAGAGNNGTDNDTLPFYPASDALDNIIAVTATDRFDLLATYSCFGLHSVDVGVPGTDVISTAASGVNHYATSSGTSFSAAIMSGAMALLRAQYPEESPVELIHRVLVTADVLPTLRGKSVSGGRLNLDRAMNTLGAGGIGYTIQAGTYAWLQPDSPEMLALGQNGVSSQLALPFDFAFCGRVYRWIYLGANGVIGFESAGLGMTANTDLPDVTVPNNMICAFWDALNPVAGSNITVGTMGLEPFRKFVVSWNGISTVGARAATLTFQAVLLEGSNEVQLQYQEVGAASRSASASGKTASIGIEGLGGLAAARFSYNGTTLLTNGMALRFVPPVQVPVLKMRMGDVTGTVVIRVEGDAVRAYQLQVSSDFIEWKPLANKVAAVDGAVEFGEVAVAPGGARFFRVITLEAVSLGVQ